MPGPPPTRDRERCRHPRHQRCPAPVTAGGRASSPRSRPASPRALTRLAQEAASLCCSPTFAGDAEERREREGFQGPDAQLGGPSRRGDSCSCCENNRCRPGLSQTTAEGGQSGVSKARRVETLGRFHRLASPGQKIAIPSRSVCGTTHTCIRTETAGSPAGLSVAASSAKRQQVGSGECGVWGSEPHRQDRRGLQGPRKLLEVRGRGAPRSDAHPAGRGVSSAG